MQVSQKGCKRITTTTHTSLLEVADLLVLAFEGSQGTSVTALIGLVYFLIGCNCVSTAILDPTPKALHFKAHLKHIGQPACKLPALVPFLRMTLCSQITWQSLICINISIQKPYWFSKARTQVALLAVFWCHQEATVLCKSLDLSLFLSIKDNVNVQGLVLQETENSIIYTSFH